MHRITVAVLLLLLFVHQRSAHQTLTAATAPTDQDYAVVNFFRRIFGISSDAHQVSNLFSHVRLSA